MAVRVNYLSRDFESIKRDLLNWAKTYHPDSMLYINDASPDIMFLEMCSYVGDMLSYYTDKTFNESFLTTAQARVSLVRIANDLGFFDIGLTPSQTQVVLSVVVPVFTDPNTGVISPDPELLPAIKSGMVVQSDSGVIFEILEEVNFADSRNRNIIPNLDANRQIINYTIEKTAVAKAGETKIQRFYIDENLAKPFLTISLDDSEVTEIIGVVATPGNTFIAPPDEDFVDIDKAFFEVRLLIEDSKFVELNPLQQPTQQTTSYISPAIKQGVRVPISKRFIVRRDVNGVVSLTFGSGTTSYNSFNNLIQNSINSNNVSLSQVLTNTTLGEIPPVNSTLFVKYRVGGGEKTNVTINQINNILAKQFYPASPNVSVVDVQNVRDSLTIRNDIPALGGTETLSVEEIRQNANKYFASQDRLVTYDDIQSIINTMPPQFGRPFRISYEEIKPRVANFQQVENGINFLLDELLTESTTIGRQLKAQEIKQFLNNLRTAPTVINNNIIQSTLDSSSLQLLGQTPTLWIGEKARLYILGIDEDGKLLSAYKDSNGLWVSPNDLLKKNIKEFIKQKRLIGDWIDIVDARIINIRIEFTVLVDKKNKQEVLIQCLNRLKEYFSVYNWQINQPIFISNVTAILQEIDGVVNVVDLKFYNIFGLGPDNKDPVTGRVYSPMETGRYRNNKPTPLNTSNNLFEMKSVNNIILNYPDSMWECRYPESDIIGKVI
jgi:hypothetical protein